MTSIPNAAKTDSVRRYYDRNTASFLSYGQGGQHGCIHRAVWGEGVETREQAFHYVDNILATTLTNYAMTNEATHIIDLGCGIGASLCFLANKFPISGTGITLSPVQQRIASSNIQKAGLQQRIQCVAGDYSDLSISLPKADLVYAIESFVHSPDPEAFFTQCKRVLRRDGLLLICDDVLQATTEPRATQFVRRYKQGWQVHSLFERRHLKQMALNAGFEHCSTTDLTPHLELTRPRDHGLSILSGLLAWFPMDCCLGHLRGGSALTKCLRQGWIKYETTLFKRSK